MPLPVLFPMQQGLNPLARHLDSSLIAQHESIRTPYKTRMHPTGGTCYPGELRPSGIYSGGQGLGLRPNNSVEKDAQHPVSPYYVCDENSVCGVRTVW